MGSRVCVVAALFLMACGAPEIESDLDTDPIPLPPRNGSSGGTSGGTSGTSGDVTPPPPPQNPKLTVTLSASGAGTVTSTPTGLTCTGATCTGTFAKGTSVSVTATPSAGAVFSGWSGACTGTAACAVKMDADVAVGADLVTLDGAWKGTYTNTRVASGCTFNNAGNVDITGTLTSTAALEHGGTIDGLELRQISGCGLVGKTNGTAPKSSITVAGDTLTGTWSFAVNGGGGSLAFPFTAKVKGKSITGTWTCTTCTGSFTLTKP